MNAKCCLLTGLAVCVLLAGAAEGDRIVLRNGNTVRGKIVNESDREVVIMLAEGMRMTLERARIREIVRDVEPPPREEPDPPPEGHLPDVPPKDPPDDPAPPETPPTPKPEPPVERPDVVFFQQSAAANWEHAFSRYPAIRAARVVRFRAYEYVSHSPIRLTGNDPLVEAGVRTCGMGGSLAKWSFKYVGMRELRFGDDVKFVAEILAAPTVAAPTILLDGGPTPTTPRIQVILVRHDFSVRRYATITSFGLQDFKRQDLEEVARRAMPIRTYGADYRPLQTTWLTPADSGFLQELNSAFGESFRLKLDRYRFRLEWFAKEPGDRPPLDAVLLRKNMLRPLAHADSRGADEATVMRFWGTYDDNWKKFVGLRRLVLERFGRIGVEPGRGYYVEQDRVGMLGRLGITIRTERHLIPEDLLADLLRTP